MLLSTSFHPTYVWLKYTLPGMYEQVQSAEDQVWACMTCWQQTFFSSNPTMPCGHAEHCGKSWYAERTGSCSAHGSLAPCEHKTKKKVTPPLVDKVWMHLHVYLCMKCAMNNSVSVGIIGRMYIEHRRLAACKLLPTDTCSYSNLFHCPHNRAVE